MITHIRSITELMITTKYRDYTKRCEEKKQMNNITEDSGQRKRYIRSTDNKSIILPEFKNRKKLKWIKGKKAIARFIDELDYNNHIQPSYELTLLSRQDKNDHYAA